MTGGGERGLQKNRYRARFILINGRSARRRTVLTSSEKMGGWAPVAALLRFSSSPLISSISFSPSSPLHLGVSCLIALGRRGDPASWLMVTPPQLVTSKRGHCSFCFSLLLIHQTERLFAKKMSCKENFDVFIIEIGWIWGGFWGERWHSDSAVYWRPKASMVWVCRPVICYQNLFESR